MTTQIFFHPKDTRSQQVRDANLISLDAIQDALENEIASYELLNPQNIYDEDNNEVLRVLECSRGNRTHQIVIAPDGFIRYINRHFPAALLQDIHNALLELETIGCSISKEIN